MMSSNNHCQKYQNVAALGLLTIGCAAFMYRRHCSGQSVLPSLQTVRNSLLFKSGLPRGSHNLETIGNLPPDVVNPDNRTVYLVNIGDESAHNLQRVIGSWSKTMKFKKVALGVYPAGDPSKPQNGLAVARDLAIDAYSCLSADASYEMPTKNNIVVVEHVQYVVAGSTVSPLVSPAEVFAQYKGSSVSVRYTLGCVWGPNDCDVFVVRNTVEGKLRKQLPDGGVEAKAGLSWKSIIEPDARSVVGDYSTLPMLVVSAASLYGSKVLNEKNLYEMHITVRANTSEEEDAFRTLCNETLGAKCVNIQLPAGADHVRQPMISYFHNGALIDALVRMYQHYGHSIASNGFEVTRLKIELQASRDAEVVAGSYVPPHSEKEAQLFMCNYFEFHIKIKIPAEKIAAHQDAMRELGKKHNAHVSRNAFKKEHDYVLWFMTQRMYGIGRDEAFGLFEACVADVKAHGLNIMSMQRELAVYDSNVGLDKGWIDARIPGTPGAFMTLPQS
eukprot:PhM_4_TR19141/c0_g1_i1/m.35633